MEAFEPTQTTLEQDLEKLLNAHCAENGSDTPDFLLAEYLMRCLDNWNAMVQAREKWHGRQVGSWHPDSIPNGSVVGLDEFARDLGENNDE